MQPETTDELGALDHILIDLHEVLARLDRLERKLAEWEEVARPLLRVRDAARFRKLGRGARDGGT